MRHFYSQIKGQYWVTLTDDLGPHITDAYPSDTIEVEPQPTPIHTYENCVWVEPDAQTSYDYYSNEVRQLRNYLLFAEVDAISNTPLKWQDLSEEKKAEWAQYRRDLLNITEQSGFPQNVIWPTKPA